MLAMEIIRMFALVTLFLSIFATGYIVYYMFRS